MYARDTKKERKRSVNEGLARCKFRKRKKKFVREKNTSDPQKDNGPKSDWVTSIPV